VSELAQADEILSKINAFKQYYICKQERVYHARELRRSCDMAYSIIIIIIIIIITDLYSAFRSEDTEAPISSLFFEVSTDIPADKLFVTMLDRYL